MPNSRSRSRSSARSRRSEAAETQEAPAPTLRSYRAITAMGAEKDRVRAGEKFEATPDDPRVKSGMVVALPDDTPLEVAVAFDQAQGLGGA